MGMLNTIGLQLDSSLVSFNALKLRMGNKNVNKSWLISRQAWQFNLTSQLIYLQTMINFKKSSSEKVRIGAFICLIIINRSKHEVKNILPNGSIVVFCPVQIKHDSAEN